MRATILLAICFLAAAVSAASFRAHQRHNCAFSGSASCNHVWTKTVKAAADDLHTVVVSVKHQANAAAACDSLLMDHLSNLNSTRFGQWLSLDQANRMFRSFENLNKAQAWLESKGFETVTKGFWIEVTAPVSQLEDVFGASFFHFKSNDGKHITRTQAYAVPREIENSIDFLSNTIVFPQVHSHIFAPAEDAAASGTVTPATLNKVYNVRSNKGSAKSTQAVFEALGQQFSPQDLTSFQSTYNLPNQAVSKIVGTNDGSQCSFNPNACVEANLDVQYLMAVSQGSPTWYWSIDSSSQDPFYAWVQALGNTQNPPLVHSISYGSIATEDPVNDMKSFNTELCVLAARGITVSVSSGDDGVANFEARSDPSQCGFNPSFPATSPYVVSVGATQGPESGNPEITCSSSTGGTITSGGGFSVTFPTPSYQSAVVANYLKNGPSLPPTSQFNSKGRGYPDVALLGFNYEVTIAGSQYGVSGTSASSPVWAGMLSLINARRMSAGKTALGFVNPLLYRLASTQKGIFNDVTVGVNNCCAAQSNPVCCQYGFTATTGWDPLTGLGSVNFENLAAALLKL